MLHRRSEIWYYDIFPKVIPVGRKIDITVRAMSAHVLFSDNTQLRIIPINTNPDLPGEQCDFSCTERELHFSYVFPSEQEYQILIFADENNLSARLSVYALRDDLLRLKPLIGDFHAHSFRSDGREGPEFVSSRYREEGFDFFTLTDHRRYMPSREAQKAFSELDLDFKIYQGEEIHTPGNPVHIVNFGTDSPVNEEYLTADAIKDSNCWNQDFRKDWVDRVKEIEDSVKDLPSGVDSYINASCLLISKLIREKGGMSILAHPHWRCNIRNDSDDWTLYWLKNGTVDAFEVLGGQTVRENTTQLALYQELRSEGYKIPIVCSSDSHGTCDNVIAGERPDYYHMFTEQRTLVFAEDNTKQDIINAVKSLKSVALEQYDGTPCRLHGPYRLVQYGLFLINEYFPLQLDMCRTEGRLMRDYAAGVSSAGAELKRIAHQTTELRNKYFSYK